MEPDAFTALYKMLAFANSCLEEGVSPDLGSVQRRPAPTGLLPLGARHDLGRGPLHGVQERPHLDRPDPVVVCERGWGSFGTMAFLLVIIPNAPHTRNCGRTGWFPQWSVGGISGPDRIGMKKGPQPVGYGPVLTP